MINVYDIVLNFSDNRVYEFFEWDKKDDIEHIKKIPLFRVSTKVLSDILNKKVIVDANFLKDIKDKTEVFTNNNEAIIEYACLFCDLSRVIAVEFTDKGINTYKSFLLLDEEEEILDVTSSLSVATVAYQVKKNITHFKFLTRKEEFIKNYLIKDLKSSYTNKNYHKINYMYEECFAYNNKKIEEKYQELLHDLNTNFTDKYLDLFQILKLSSKRKVK